MDTIEGRLNRALDTLAPADIRGDRKAFQRRMRERMKGSRDGTSYPAVLGYLKGRVAPSVEWLDVASDVLGVRQAWLTLGHGVPLATEQAALDDRRLRELVLSHLEWLRLTAGQEARVVEVCAQFHAARVRLFELVGQQSPPAPIDTAWVFSDLLKATIRPFIPSGTRYTLDIDQPRAQQILDAVLLAITLSIPDGQSVTWGYVPEESPDAEEASA
jgi:hypothetical protein